MSIPATNMHHPKKGGNVCKLPCWVQSNSTKDGGSQIYNDADCTAILAAFNRILPLGSQEWDQVEEIYNYYATNNNWI
ncbi:uncharacterized protein VP01_405g5 [Puccinia sorghi]|uniref:Uncharacterized protein n=1 Tax=Puccinia sorghi TaxID=27349 RepID=A0A0L6UTH5_9BASI|nr:uncharacterized protein VP01_405g5 [Puccinia sorghi]